MARDTVPCVGIRLLHLKQVGRIADQSELRERIFYAVVPEIGIPFRLPGARPRTDMQSVGPADPTVSVHYSQEIFDGLGNRICVRPHWIVSGVLYPHKREIFDILF